MPFVLVPNQNGGTSAPGGASPAMSGGGGGSAPAVPNLANLPTVGGMVGITTQMLAIGFDDLTQSNLVYFIDPMNHNCEESTEYDFKVEEIEPGNQITIHRVVLRYRDLGVVSFTVAVVSADLPNLDYTKGTGNAVLVTVGTPQATRKIYTKQVALNVTTEAPQVKILRAAKAGPLAITKVRAWGSYGDGDII